MTQVPQFNYNHSSLYRDYFGVIFYWVKHSLCLAARVMSSLDSDLLRGYRRANQ